MDRSQRLEEIVDKMPKKTCKFGGCGFKKVILELVRAHEENDCRFRIVQCGKCDCRIQMSGLIEHLGNQHGRPKFAMNFSSQSQCTINLENMKKAQGMKVIDDNLIFFDNWSEQDDASYVTWISFYGPKCEA